MALTRKALKAMGITDEQVDSIIDMHTETVDALKEQIKTAQKRAADLEGIEKQFEEFKANNSEDYKGRYEAEHKAFEDYKAEQQKKETHAAKEAAARKYFKDAGIDGANLEIAMRGAREEIDALEIEGEAIKDSKSLESLVKGTYAGLVITREKRGAQTSTPPTQAGGGATTMTKAEIMKIKDTAARQKAIAENIELFRR